LITVAVGCATRRGYQFLSRLRDLLPEAQIVVFSFKEEPWEPSFVDDIKRLTHSFAGQFIETRQMGAPSLAQFWEATPIDLMFLVSWRYIIPATVFKTPRLGTFVFHDSVLPEYRGFSPTVWAIINGGDYTGVTLFEICEEVDAGNIVDQQRVPIGQTETITEVLDRVTQTYLLLLERNLKALIEGVAQRYPQDSKRATYTCKRMPEDNKIRWSLPARRIFDLVRAVTSPYPGAFTTLAGKTVRVWASEDISQERKYVGAIPGRVAEVWSGRGAVVVTGDGTLLLTKVQMHDSEVVCAADVLKVGQTFDQIDK
jgi:methionyl-tRNA formyltransferase